MKKFLVYFAILLLTAAFSSGCTTTTDTETGKVSISTTLGDGVFDANEQALFKVAVGTGLSIEPALAAPVYAVATVAISISSGTPTEIINAALADEIAKIELEPVLLASLNDYLDALKAKMNSVLKQNGVDEKVEAYAGIIKQMLVIVQASAKARM